MNVINQFRKTFEASSNFLQDFLNDYISFNSESSQLVLKQKTVLLLCQQAVSKVENLKSLEPDSEEGLIATLDYKGIDIKVHFTPEKITLYEDSIEGQLRLLNSPEFQADSFFYRILLEIWKTFLGGQISSGSLPKEVRIEKEQVYYTIARNQLKLLNALFLSLKNGSTVLMSLRKGELILESSAEISWKDINFEQLLEALGLKVKLNLFKLVVNNKTEEYLILSRISNYV